MGLELNQLVQPDYSAQYLWVTDKTGAYDATSNATGWGDVGDPAANFRLNESALGVVVIARDAARTVFGNVSPQWKFSSSADPDTENQFQISYVMDSVIDVYSIRLMVANHTPETTDPIISLDSITMGVGDYWYNNTDSKVYKKVDGVTTPVEVTDMRELVDALSTLEAGGNTVSVLCTDAYVIKLAVEYGKEYKNYVIKRKEGCSDLKTIFFNMLNFKEDIIGARRSYTSGLFSQTQDIIETLTEEKNI